VLPGGFWKGYIVLSLDSTKFARPLTDDQIVQMAVMTEKPIVITGQVGDRRLADQIGQASGCAVFPTCGDLTLAELASVWSNAKGVIVFDPIQAQVVDALGIKCYTVPEKTTVHDPQDIALWARSQFTEGNERSAI
jgi:ADP-heptose:LPS heptosyltransferase